MFKLAHISDLHLSKISFSPFQFFSKRWIGNFCHILIRKKIFQKHQLYSLTQTFEKLQVDYILITGDLSTTSQEKEFTEGHKIINKWEKLGFSCLCLPGNHDMYTKRSHRKKLFYNFFTNPSLSKDYETKKFSLKVDGVEARPLKDNWWIILLDSTLATSLFSSRGLFSIQVEKNLKKVLSLIPKDASIILANHFPFTHHISPRKILIRSTHLRSILQHNHFIKLYLHGHTHNHSIADLRANNLPIVLDSGCSAHSFVGRWNLLEISPASVDVNAYHWSKNQWKQEQKQSFYWK